RLRKGDGLSRNPLKWEDRTRWRVRSVLARGDTGNAGWYLRRLRIRRIGAWSTGVRDAWWSECRACKEGRPGNRDRFRDSIGTSPHPCKAAEWDGRKSS